MIDKGHEAADREIERITKELHKLYSESADELGKEWKDYLMRSEKQRKELYKRISEAATPEDRRAARQAYNDFMRYRTTMDSRYRSMTENLAEQISNVNEQAAGIVNGHMPRVYAENWNYSGKNIELQTGAAVRFDIINPHTVEELVKTEANFFPKYYINRPRDVAWNIQNVNSAVAKGIIKGDSIPKITARLKDVVGMNEVASVREARTITTSVENQARMDTAHEAQEKGVIMKKVWYCTHDSRTREWHVQADRDYHADSKAIDIDEPFIVGGEDMMYPGDPNGSPENVYNCRCTTAHVIKGFTSILPPEKRGKIRVTFG